MKILITGANGFIGKNLCARLKMIQEGKDYTHPQLVIDEIYEWNRDTPEQKRKQYCENADFVFHLAGINRPENPDEYMSGNCAFTSEVINTLREAKNNCPFMLASSIQASLLGRYKDSAYGTSKLESETVVFQYAKNTGVKVLVYRFPNVFGKWCRPNYNSAIATFCYNISRDLPISVNDSTTQLELLYIDDLVEEMLYVLEGKEHRCVYDKDMLLPKDDGAHCYVPITYRVSLKEIVNSLNCFHEQPQTLMIPEQPINSFQKKLYATYLSYLPKEKMSFVLKTNVDHRGSFTELFKSEKCGQVSVNISKPGITKGQHWHNTKWEFFIVVSGHGLIQERKIGSDEVIEFEVSGSKIEAVHMLPGYTHNIINLSDTENLVTVMWANEKFDSAYPDTYHEEV